MLSELTGIACPATRSRQRTLVIWLRSFAAAGHLISFPECAALHHGGTEHHCGSTVPIDQLGLDHIPYPRFTLQDMLRR